ncbi:amidophosphorybosyltransferase [Desulfotignum phosphitoxidans DSM 13687]|uniref:Amidophosphorybosyltransferase n=1 Tax=Desulfotignum phosphitoxidans DSM 13687 TaxID=1286635 RepID=S0G3M0_9BACT|nr:amidophosphorybosyltransferase [Desulfotignum phosphitoxidans DSM 13687]
MRGLLSFSLTFLDHFCNIFHHFLSLHSSSESTAFSNLGFETDYFVGPDEIVKITPDGYEQLKAPGDKMQVCSFLWVYYGYPVSSYEGINTEQVRYNCGTALAKRETSTADFVAGIPDSGIGHAIGFSNESKIPYMRPYVNPDIA